MLSYLLRELRLVRDATVFNYERISFPQDWEIELDTPAIELFECISVLARAENMPEHAKQAEIRVKYLTPQSRIKVGRLKNGIATITVINCSD